MKLSTIIAILTDFNKKGKTKMLIKCENCSVVYKVPDERLALEHPRFFKCSACGNVFEVSTEKVDEDFEDVVKTEEETKEPLTDNVVEDTEIVESSSVPQVEQTDAIPMPLSDIFNPDESDLEEDAEPVQTEQTEKESEVNLFEPLDVAEEFSPVSSDSSQNKGVWSFFAAFIVAFAAAFLLFYVGRYFFIRKVPATEKIYQSVGIKTEVLGEGLAFQNTLFDIQKESRNYELIIKSQIVNTTDEVKKIPNVVVRLLDEKNKVIQTGYIQMADRNIEAGQTRPIETHLKELLEGAKRVEITFERNIRW